jgi:ribosomal protein L37AE/L43A
VDLNQAPRERVLNEVGSEPDCPNCKRPRVRRSDYVRCSLCGRNWLDGEDLLKDPREGRRMKMFPNLYSEVKKPARRAEED